MDDQEKQITAYHEGGHALVAAALPGNDPVHKITILPRGRALGYTMVLPDQDKYSTTRSEMLNQLAYMLGGRAAEELVFHDPTTGASNDIEKATAVARAMVTQYGMTERLGAIRYGQEQGEVFLGRDMGHTRDYSEEVAAAIDEEVRSAHRRTRTRRPSRSSSTTATCSTRWCSSCSRRRRSTRREVARDLRAELKLRAPARPAWTGSARRDVPSERGPVADRPTEVAAPTARTANGVRPTAAAERPVARPARRRRRRHGATRPPSAERTAVPAR